MEAVPVEEQHASYRGVQRMQALQRRTSAVVRPAAIKLWRRGFFAAANRQVAGEPAGEDLRPGVPRDVAASHRHVCYSPPEEIDATDQHYHAGNEV